MLIKVFCVVSMLSKLPPAVCLRGGEATGLLNKGGGSNRLPVEFPQVQTSMVTSYPGRPSMRAQRVIILSWSVIHSVCIAISVASTAAP